MNHTRAVITETRHSPSASLAPVPIPMVKLEAGFWHSRVEVNRSVTIPSQFELLESTGRLDNFRRVAYGKPVPYKGYVFNDSDVYKWLEAAAWASVGGIDGELGEKVSQIIELISATQASDGYLNTYFSVERSGERWTNMPEKHEMYCAGHLIQAAVAHFRSTGEDSLLGVAIRLADHIYNTFGPGRDEGICGHPQIEMALVELYRATKDEKYLQLAKLFIDRRGRGILGGNEYLVDHVPFRSLERLAGHAVRALYLCCGAADVALELGDQQLIGTLERLWVAMVGQQMYITGGVGARHDGEAFGNPYELPNSRAYAETCAAIASLIWSWRMLLLTGKAQYADLIEWTLYNAILPGVSLDGREYFYVNPLQDDGFHRRQPWFECACCPPNISRTIAMFPGYIYSVSSDGLWVNTYSSSTAKLDLPGGQSVHLQQKTDYPWDGTAIIEVLDVSLAQQTKAGSTQAAFSIFLRLPGWLESQQAMVKINSEPLEHKATPGSYLEVSRSWRTGDRIEIVFPMAVKYLACHPSILENIGRVALSRGPLVYCLESVDNPGIDLTTVLIEPGNAVDVEFMPEFSSSMVCLHFQAGLSQAELSWKGKLYRPHQSLPMGTKPTRIAINCIPYFAWANRAPGAMQVWLKIIN